jgi:hypothetical protein
LADKLKRKLAEAASGDIEERIAELRERLTAILNELKEMNKTLREIKALLEAKR